MPSVVPKHFICRQSRDYEQAVTSSLVANVANLYYTLLMLDDQLRISEETAANWHESVKTMKAMMAAGMTNEAAVSQSEATCRQVEASVLDLRQQIDEVETHYPSFWGMCLAISHAARWPARSSRKSLQWAFPCNFCRIVPM